MKKRVFSLVLTLVMLLGLLPTAALAADDATTAWLASNQLYVGDIQVTAANADDILAGVNQGEGLLRGGGRCAHPDPQRREHYDIP